MSGDIFGGPGNLINDAKDSLFGTKQGTIDTNSSSSPWAPQQPYLTDLFSRAQGAVNNPYSGPALSPAATGQLQDTINGKYLDPSLNPALQGYVNDALGLAKSQFAGQYGGPAGANLGNSGYQEMLTRTLANTALPIYANAYGQERQNQLQAAQAAPGIDTANRTSPFAPLLAYQQLIGGNYGSQGTQQQPFYQNQTATTLGGLAGAAGMAKMFSDRRLKSNIVKIGEDPRGFGLYEYDIFGKRQCGVMADEVEKVIPEAVSELLGMKQVDYGRI
jgi:hypothetical protein